MEPVKVGGRKVGATASEPSSPIFIMGCMRSGTTFLSELLVNHPRIAAPRETFYYTIFRPLLRYYGDLHRQSNLILLIKDVEETLGWTEVNHHDIEKALNAPTFKDVFDTLLFLYARSQNKVRGGDKTPDHHNCLPHILEDFPESPVIFMIRDPRDTIFSINKAFGSSIDEGVELWNRAFLSYLKNLGLVHPVRYEELVQKPNEVLNTVCSFIGESYEPRMLRFYVRKRSRPADIRHHHKRLLEPINDGSVGNFRLMSPFEIERIEHLCSEGMKALGYQFTTVQKISKSTGWNEPNTNLNFFRFLMYRLRYYRLDSGRWKAGWRRWKLIMIVRMRYWLSLIPLRERSGK